MSPVRDWRTLHEELQLPEGWWVAQYHPTYDISWETGRTSHEFELELGYADHERGQTLRLTFKFKTWSVDVAWLHAVLNAMSQPGHPAVSMVFDARP